MKEILQKKLRGKDQLEHLTKKGPALKASEEGESRDREKREEGFTKSDLWTKCYSFINSQEYKKDLSIYNAFKSHRRKTEMNSTHLLLGLSLRKK